VTDASPELVALLREAGRAHHQAFAATDGADPEWPTWYAEFLAPRLRVLLGQSLPVSDLAQRLRQWHTAHERSGSGEEWPEFYARSLVTLRNPGN
jgi:NAD(P)H-hydrate epimerase